MSSPCSRLIRLSYVRILCKLRTQSRGRRYRSLPTYVFVSNAARSRPREERWELWQERARWLNLANLSDREKDDVLDMPIVPEGIFGSALASMQRRCEAKKKEDEALQLCLPRKPPAPSPPAQRKTLNREKIAV